MFDNYVEWLALMQHHGAPTRLLNCSLSPCVGPYFAVAGHPNDDAALWFFDHTLLWQTFCHRFQLSPRTVFDFPVLPATLLTTPQHDVPLLFSAMKKMRSACESAQQGVFAFCDHLQADDQAAVEATVAGGCGRIRIPALLKRDIKSRLRMMNLTPAALFPGVDGICQAKSGSRWSRLHPALDESVRNFLRWSGSSP